MLEIKYMKLVENEDFRDMWADAYISYEEIVSIVNDWDENYENDIDIALAVLDSQMKYSFLAKHYEVKKDDLTDSVNNMLTEINILNTRIKDLEAMNFGLAQENFNLRYNRKEVK